MYRIVAVVTCALSLFAASVSGQRQITGRLIDGETRQPVKDVLVKIEGKEIETRSNFLGFFQLTVDSLDQLLISGEGYELARAQIPEVSGFQIALTKSTGPKDPQAEFDEPATFPGGWPAFYEYITKSLRYPKDALKAEISGKVFVEFVVDNTGQVPPEQVKVIKGIYKSCDDEAARVISESPRWNPATKKGKPVIQSFVMPIGFKSDVSNAFYIDFYTFMSQNIQYPAQARRSGIQGAVIIDFVVDDGGKVLSAELVKAFDGGCGDEVRRALLSVPNKLMTALANKSNATKFTLPVLFGLETPLKNPEPNSRSEGFLLSPVLITASSVKRVGPNGYAHAPHTASVWDQVLTNLTAALEKPTKVRHLSLTNRAYTSFPPEILTLINLEFLDLEHNAIKELPPEIGSLKELKELYIVENHIEALPDKFQNLKNLKVLGLASNKFKSFPEEITSLEKLEVLDLSNNALSSIPPSIGKMTSLKFLVLQNNDIKSLPPEFYQLKKLEKIYLQGNPLDIKEKDLLKRSFQKAEILL